MLPPQAVFGTPKLTPEQLAALTAQALAAPPPTPEQRRRLRPLLAGTIPAPLASVALWARQRAAR